MLKSIFSSLTSTVRTPAASGAIRSLTAAEVAAVAGGPEIGHDIQPTFTVTVAVPPKA